MVINNLFQVQDKRNPGAIYINYWVYWFKFAFIVDFETILDSKLYWQQASLYDNFHL